jgi:uroporphyrinogen-III synthase
MRVLVTRPVHEAQRWVVSLCDQGHDAVALPLIDIAPARDPQPLLAAWKRIARYDALMFVSGNAVRHFFRPAGDCAMAPPVWGATAFRAWTTGPGTARALRQAGLASDRIDVPAAHNGTVDSEALWQRVRGQVRPGFQVLLVRGGDATGQLAGRDWLAAQLQAAGALVDALGVYERHLPAWDASQRALAQQAASDASLWLFSSAQALEHLRLLLPAQSWNTARALATHARIAQAARNCGFSVVLESRPNLSEVLASIESLA